jgi:hypothetical protein
VRLSRPQLAAVLFGVGDPEERIAETGAEIAGDASLFATFVDLIEPLVANFPIVTP